MHGYWLLPDLSLTATPPRPELLRQLRLRLPEVLPGVRLVAEGMLGAGALIDFVGVDSDGRAVLVLVGEGGDDLALLGRALAQRAWVDPRLRDWLQLAPDLGVRPEAGVRVLLLAAEFGPEARAAVETLGADAPELWDMRCLRNGSGVTVLLEPAGVAAAPPVAGAVPSAEPIEPAPGALPHPVFRTGLTEADLDLTPAERREFE